MKEMTFLKGILYEASKTSAIIYIGIRLYKKYEEVNFSVFYELMALMLLILTSIFH